MSIEQFSNLLYKSWLKVSGSRVQAVEVIANDIKCSSNAEQSNNNGSNININYILPKSIPVANTAYNLMADVNKQLAFSEIPAVISPVIVWGWGYNDGPQYFNFPTDYAPVEFPIQSSVRSPFLSNQWYFDDAIPLLGFTFTTTLLSNANTEGTIYITINDGTDDRLSQSFIAIANVWYPFSLSSIIPNNIPSGARIGVKLDLNFGYIASLQSNISFYNLAPVIPVAYTAANLDSANLNPAYAESVIEKPEVNYQENLSDSIYEPLPME